MKANFEAINDLGTARSILEGKESNPLMLFVQENLQQLVEEIKSKGNRMDVRASNNLLSSFIATNIKVSDKGVDADVIADDYWKFINYGVNGRRFSSAPNWKALGVQSKPFNELVSSVSKWIPFRGLQPKEGQTYDELATSLAFAILKNGKVAKPFVTEAVKETKVLKDLTEGIGKMIGKSVAVNIKEQFRNGNNNSK